MESPLKERECYWLQFQIVWLWIFSWLGEWFNNHNYNNHNISKHVLNTYCLKYSDTCSACIISSSPLNDSVRLTLFHFWVWKRTRRGEERERACAVPWTITRWLELHEGGWMNDRIHKQKNWVDEEKEISHWGLKPWQAWTVELHF